MGTLQSQYDSTKFSLAAINILLQSINEEPVEDSEEASEIREAVLASSVLEETKTQVLSEGWDTNSDTNWEFAPNSDGKITLPANVLDLSDTEGRYFMRDWLVYDKQDRTFKFDEPITADVIWNLDFNSLPHAIRYYITIKASRTFQYRQIGDVDQYQFSKEDLDDAFLAAKNSEMFTGKYSLKGGDYATNFDRTN